MRVAKFLVMFHCNRESCISSSASNGIVDAETVDRKKKVKTLRDKTGVVYQKNPLLKIAFAMTKVVKHPAINYDHNRKNLQTCLRLIPLFYPILQSIVFWISVQSNKNLSCSVSN